MDAMKQKNGESLNVIEENIKALKAIFPDASTEDGIDFETLRQLLGDQIADHEEKYGLTWHGKRNARRIALTPSTGTLRPCPDESTNWAETRNLLIEGDNLEVLKLLLRAYSGCVRLIYIDPPYNTGGEFIYPDNFHDNIDTYLRYTGQRDDKGLQVSSNAERSGRFHTTWLNMMYPRLKLAKSLLSEEGAMFVSIDDHEVDNLRLICDEIFGEENFVASVIWQKVFSPKNTAQYFSEDHDYVIVYAKNKEVWRPTFLPRSEQSIARYTNPDNDPRGPWLSGAMQARNYYGKGQYEVVSPSGAKFSNPLGTYWRFSKDKFDELNGDNRIWWGESGGNVPRLKRFLSEVRDGVVPQTLWKFEEVGHTQEAKEELLEYVNFRENENVLNSVKPSKLIKKIVQIGTSSKEADIVLDFFSGSGVTGQAVLEKNLEDQGNRRVVLVQLPEPLRREESKLKTIADFSRERIRSTRHKILSVDPKTATDLGFKVFKLDSSNIRAWIPDITDLEKSLLDHTDHLVEGRSEQDVLYELLLKRGVDLTVPIEQRKVVGKTLYSIGFGVLFACLDDEIAKDEIEPLAQGITAWHEELEPTADTQVVFRDSAFADDIAKTNMTAILEQNGIAHVRSL